MSFLDGTFGQAPQIPGLTSAVPGMAPMVAPATPGPAAPDPSQTIAPALNPALLKPPPPINPRANVLKPRKTTEEPEQPAAPAKPAEPLFGTQPDDEATTGAPTGEFKGVKEPGNIDVSQRPVVRNPDGTISTVRSKSFNFDGDEVLLPTVSEEGKLLSDDEAIAEYRKTGKHLGKFDTPANADAYATSLHDAQEKRYVRPPGPRGDLHDTIRQGSAEENIDPAYALATAERESTFNPGEGGTGTIRGMYQMTHGLRYKHGIGESTDPYVQTRGFGSFTNELRGEMKSVLGRDPTWAETYAGHHFGGVRAARIINGQIDPRTPVQAVFTSKELKGNPHIVRAGTVGTLMNQTIPDMERRMARYREGGSESDQLNAKDRAAVDAMDFSNFGDEVELTP